MSQTLKHSTIFTLLDEYLGSLRSLRVFGEWRKTLHKLWDSTDDAHRRVILDIFAYTNMQNNEHDPVKWGSHGVHHNSSHPGLTLVMRALASHTPLIDVSGFSPKRFDTPQLVEQLTHEVNEQNHWRNSHPYFCDVGFLREGEHTHTKKAGTTIDFSVQTANLVNQQIAATLLVPASMAGVVLWCRTNPIDWDTVFPVEVIPAATACQHQHNMLGSGTEWVFGIAVANCAPKMVRTLVIEGQQALKADDYLMLTDTLETLFPVREYMYQQATRGFRFASVRDWVIRRALGELFDIFIEAGGKMRPLATRLWVIENYTPTEGLVMRLNHATVF